MKILHVVNISFVLPYYIGAQFDFFKKKEIDVFVACSPSEHFENYSLEKNFVTVPVNILRSINPIADIRSIIVLKNKILEEEIDVVIGHTPKGAMVAMISSYLAGTKKRIYFRHGLMYETSKGLKKIILKGVERLTARLATKIICVSESVLHRSNSERLNNPAKNILLNKGTCNGIDINKFSPKNIDESLVDNLRKKHKISTNEKLIGFVGRLVNDKGINELLEAWNMLTKEFNNIKLLLVGPFEERDSISEVNKRYIEKNQSIIHTGLIEDVLPYYHLMDIFILPSYREGFPTVVLEASAMELPIVTTKATGCIDSILENITGIYSEINPIEIANALKFYIQNKEISQLHGINGRRYVIENFKQEVIWEEIHKILKENT